MIRVVLDTNIIVSGTFWTGVSFRILKLVDEGKLHLVISPALLKEYLQVLQSNEIIEKIDEQTMEAELAAVQKLFSQAILVEPTARVTAVAEDPDDNKVLEAALAGGANYVITQDKHLLKLKTFEKTSILRPEAFLEVFH